MWHPFERWGSSSRDGQEEAESFLEGISSSALSRVPTAHTIPRHNSLAPALPGAWSSRIWDLL